jgi:beta-phosphoglucomutase-like phosphatase (HAD superfamily)
MRNLDFVSLKFILFDLDGVLWSSNAVHAEAFNKTCNQLNLQTISYAELAGQTTESAARRILKLNGLEGSLNYQQKLTSFVLQKKKNANSLLQAKSDDELRIWNDFSIFGSAVFGLITGSSFENVENYLQRIGFNPFSYISHSKTSLAKPNPDGYIKAINALKCDSNSTVVLEDSANGLAAAEAANLPFVHIYGDWGICTINHSQQNFCGCFKDLWQATSTG